MPFIFRWPLEREGHVPPVSVLSLYGFSEFFLSLEAQFDKPMNEERAYSRLMKVKLNGAILLKPLTHST